VPHANPFRAAAGSAGVRLDGLRFAPTYAPAPRGACASRSLLLLSAVVALAASGCFGKTAGPAGAAATAGMGGWHLDCSFIPTNASWPQRCETQATFTPGTKAEPWIAINPTNPRNVVVASKDMNPTSSKSCVWNGLGVTHDAGATWHGVTIGGPFSERSPGSPFYGYACDTDAMFQFDAHGDLYYGVEMYDLEGVLPIPRVQDPTGAWNQAGPFAWGWKILLATSHDGGDTWPDVITFQEGQPTETDYSRMIVSPTTGTILEAINNISGGITCHVLSSRDGGKTAALPAKATPLDNPADSICRSISVSPTGTVVIGFRDGLKAGVAGGERRVAFVRSTDDGKTFLDGNGAFPYKPIPDPFPNMKAPSRNGQQFECKYDLVSAAGKGTLWCITAEDPAGNGDANVYVRFSKDDARTWSDPVQVNDPAVGHEQWMPQLAIAQDGTLHAFYFDRGYSDGHLVDVTHAVSTDQGKTWRSERVTSVSWDPDTGRHQDGYPWIGDYIGADAVGDDVWATVPDTSLGGPPQLAAIHVVKG